jgi:hypothetical protein
MDVPAELARLRQWIVWRDEGGRKIPYQVTGQKARSNDPQTWSTLEEAQKVAPGYSGLGFVFAEGGGLWGMDLDGCRNPETGELAEWAECIVNELATYAEVSPSGTGVKLWGFGHVGPGKKIQIDEPKICSKAPAIEAYDHGRYFTFTGQRLGEWGLRAADVEPILKAYSPKPIFFPSVDQRPAAYIQSVPGCSEGGRNQTAFRLAATLLNDFALGELDAWPLLCSWNDRNTPPLAESELRTCFASAGRNAKKPRGSKVAEDPAPVDLSGILSPKAAPAPEPEDPFPAWTVPGLIDDIVRYNLRTALYPQPELALAGAIALIGVLTGRRVTDQRGTRTNVYVLGMAPSGGGKEHARKINKEILLRAGKVGEAMIGPERIASSAGLVSSVAAQPAILFQLDEIGRLLSTMKNPGKQPHLYNIGTVLLQLYSSADSLWIADAYADQKKTKRINQPHACIYGTTVPGAFWDNLTADNVSEGLLGRLMTFEASSGYVPMAQPQAEPVPEGILERVRSWLEFGESPGNLGAENPTPMVVSYSAAAKRRMDEHLAGICHRRTTEDETRAAVWSRSGEKSAKLALIFACSRATPSVAPRVELEDVDCAIRISNWLTRRMLRKAFEHVAENETESRSKKVLRLITSELTQTELTRRTQWLRRKERDEILAELQACGYIQIEQKETGGRPLSVILRKR